MQMLKYASHRHDKNLSFGDRETFFTEGNFVLNAFLDILEQTMREDSERERESSWTSSGQWLWRSW